MSNTLNSSFIKSFISRFGGIVPGARDLQEEQFHPDAFAALMAAMEYFNPLSAMANVSFGGVVYHQSEAGFAFSGSVVCSGAKTIHYSPVRIRECATAFWRTSGQVNASLGKIVSRYFSDAETELANRFNLPFYLSSNTGVLKIYQPGDCTLSIEVASRLLGVSETGFALGALVHDEFGRAITIGTQLQPQHFVQCEELAETPVSMAISRYARETPVSMAISRYASMRPHLHL